MERTYSPDKWEIIKFQPKDKPVYYKVLGSWSGGYLDGDSWRLSSGLEKIEQDVDYFYFHNYSGSVYKGHKKSKGMHMLSAGIYAELKEGSKEQNITVSISSPVEFREDQLNEDA